MTTKIAAIPPLDGVKDPAIKRVLQSIKEMLEVRDGQRKGQDGLDRFVTLREFADAANGVPGTSKWIASANQGAVGSLIGAIANGEYDKPDLSRPPTLSGLAVSATMTTAVLSWNSWTSDKRHGMTEVWRASVDDIGQAVLVGTAPGDVYFDPVGEPGQVRYYWIRAISRWNGAPAGDFNSTAGVRAETVADPQAIFSSIIGSDPSVPFVHYPSNTTINGQFVPAGTYIKSLYVPYGVINKLHFDRATGNRIIAEDAMFGDVLSDTIKVVNANIAGEIKSDNYEPGSAGWRIHKSGVAELSNAIVRGTIYANGGEFYGTLKGGYATSYTAGTGLWAGFHGDDYVMRLGSTSSYLRWDGSSIELRGTLNITDGSGNVLMSSGDGIPWDRIGGTEKPQDGATRNVFRGDWIYPEVYRTGDIVMRGGNSWSAVADHNSTLASAPPESGSGNAWWALYGAKGADGVTYNIDIESTNGNIFRPGQGSATILIAHVYRNGVDITDELPGSVFRWRRVSYEDPEPPNNDAAWNSLYQSGYKQVMVTTDSIMNRATYHCDILI